MHAFRCLCVCNVSYTHAETQKHIHTHTQSGTWLKTTPQQQNYFLSWWIITTALRRRGSGNHLKSMFDDIGVYGHFPWQTVWFVEGMVRVLHSIPIESPFLLVKSPFLLVKSPALSLVKSRFLVAFVSIFVGQVTGFGGESPCIYIYI